MRKLMNAVNLKDLKMLRTKRKLTQMDVCIKVGVSLLTYQLWERGITTPNEQNYEKLNEVFKGGE